MRKKYRRGLTILALFFSQCAARASAEETFPQWMHSKNLTDVTRPDGLGGAEQEECTQVILDEINRRLKTSFDRDNVAPIRLDDWTRDEMGFVRGGGFNIRIAGSMSSEHSKRTHLRAARFADFATWLELGARASLHIPRDFDGETVFLKSERDDQVNYDFVAHMDTGYAYLPLGLLIHGLRDVAGADGRNPCPAEPGLD
jgi:hypothetical protein